MIPTPLQKKIFITAVRKYAKAHGRSFPWRETTDPYHILVSEIMLQQTQVERVIPKYKEFLKKFKTIRILAKASLGDVLRVWNGLGYNRRAKMLHQCAQEIMRLHKGVIPQTEKELINLSGIGPYTAGALLAFAFNRAIPIIETNIRTVYLHHFFPYVERVSDERLMSLIELTLDKKNPRHWYGMLMDYGAWIKKAHGNPNRRSKTHVPQKTFKGSDREIRGAILRMLLEGNFTIVELQNNLTFKAQRVDKQIKALIKEGLLVLTKGVVRLP